MEIVRAKTASLPAASAHMTANRTASRASQGTLIRILLAAAAASSLLAGLAHAGDGPRRPESGRAAQERSLWGNDPAMPLLKIQGDQPDLLQVGRPDHAYWIADGVWGAKGLTRGTFTGMRGTAYETAYGASTHVGPDGEVGWRSAWKFPDTPEPCGPASNCYQEIKTYASAVFGAKPGWANDANMPGGFKVRLWPRAEYSYARTKTPGSFLPLHANGALPPIYSSFSYRHLVAPDGKGQLSYDIWLQNTPAQCHGFNVCHELTHEIMIPVTYWGGYGRCGTRNEPWKVKDSKGVQKVVRIEGRDWCLYLNRHMGGSWDPVKQAASGGWTFVVFEPVEPLAPETVHRLNLSSFVNFLATQTDAHGQKWAARTEHLVSVELGVEVQFGVGDTEVTNYRVWKR
jgi:hypothetical protein